MGNNTLLINVDIGETRVGLIADGVLRELALIKVSAQPEGRTEIISLAGVFKAKIVDVGAESLIMQITATEDRVDSLVELLAEHLDDGKDGTRH